jgi:uncharacterized protein
MALVWDETKRRKTLDERGLDFAEAERVFASGHFTRGDDRHDYGEPRFVTVGYLKGRFVVVTWTPRGHDQRIISMRFGHGQEEDRFKKYVD